MNNQEIELTIHTELMLSMALAMIKQKCPDTTALAGMNMTLGEWKSMMKLTPKELKQLDRRVYE